MSGGTRALRADENTRLSTGFRVGLRAFGARIVQEHGVETEA
jgi:hypothetical protein